MDELRSAAGSWTADVDARRRTSHRPLDVSLADSFSGPVGPTRGGLLRPLDRGAVQIDPDSLLGIWQSRNRSASLGHVIANLETSGVLENFRRVAAGVPGKHRGMQFADSDLYKTLEAIAWESGRVGYRVEPEFVDSAVSLIEAAQDVDGYLNTYVQGDPSRQRWTELVWSHELYCAGHLFQAAVAFHRALGDDRLLEAACLFADRIVSDLGRRDDGYDGHAQIETALVELYRTTGTNRYLGFARTQIERRGHRLLAPDPFGREYFGDHEPIDSVTEAVGHAVRQLYFATGALDVYLETGEQRYLDAVTRIWRSAYTSKTYITGGQGSRHHGEAFGDPYELPPDRAYAETCAGIAAFQWNWRMLLATGEARFAQEMETVLYNTIAAAVSFNGCRFFYTNPLQLRTEHRGTTENAPSARLSWYECACCPPNLSRLMASLDNYVATSSAAGVQVHHLVGARVSTLVGGSPVDVVVESDYPWSGTAEVKVSGDEFELAIRLPTGATDCELVLDGKHVPVEPTDGYVRLTRDWTGTHRLTIQAQLPTEAVTAHPRVDAVRGTIALRRGPLVYCIESSENPYGTLEDVRVDPASFEPASGADLGVPVILQGRGVMASSDSDNLYAGNRTPRSEPASQVDVTAVPYYAWGNHGDTAMRVWIPALP